MIGALVLAAGRGTRFGSDKRLAILPGGGNMLLTTLSLVERVFDDVLLVLAADDRDLAQSLRPRRTYCAPDAHLGMGHSLAGGIAEAGAWDAAAIVLADMPFVRAASLRRLRQAWEERRDRQAIVVPVFEGRTGNPVVFDRRYFAEIAELKGDAGAREIVRRHADRVVRVALDDPGIAHDIDTPADLPGPGRRQR